MTLDAEIDALYKGPLSEFTAARNALAKSLGGEEAKRVKKLAKPTVVPWTVNQLFWHDRAVFDRLMKSGDALREAQIATLQGKPADVRRASEQHRQALADAIDRALQLAAGSDVKPDAEPLSRMLEALSVSPTRPAPGRLTEIVQPAGFEALLGIQPAGRPAGPHAVAPKAKPAPEERKPSAAARKAAASAERARTLEAEREKARQKQLQAAVQAAERDLARARAAEAKARDRFDEARQELERTAQAARFAERALAAARASLGS